MSVRIRSQVALAVLLGALLFGGLAPALSPTTPKSGLALVFFSSNTEEGLTLHQAVERWEWPEHVRCRHLTRKLLAELDAGSALVHDGIGDWADGVEHSLLVVWPESIDIETLRQAAAWLGLLGDQKAVLAFRADPHGEDRLLRLFLPGSLADVRDWLSRHGIHERTILMDDVGCYVLVVDDGRPSLKKLKRLVQQRRGRIEAMSGRLEVLAAPTRDEARKRYHEVLRHKSPAALVD